MYALENMQVIEPMHGEKKEGLEMPELAMFGGETVEEEVVETTEEEPVEEEKKEGECHCEACPKHAHVSSAQKWKYTLITTVIFLVVVHPMTYKLVNSLVSKVLFKVASKSGCPTMAGLLLHAVVFTIALRYVMDLNI